MSKTEYGRQAGGRKSLASWLVHLSVACLLVVSFPGWASKTSPVVLSEFISKSPPTPQSHASTIVETPAGLVVAWFGGKQERDPGVGIWLSRHISTGWTSPIEVANGVSPSGPRQPCWNPVLFQPRGGPLMLFYKVGPDPARWWGMLKTSSDNGEHWSHAKRLRDGILGPIKDKPVQLADGIIISPSSEELGSWRIHFERSVDGGRKWSVSKPIANPLGVEAIQPTLLRWGKGDLQAIGRTKQNRLFSTRSKDGGVSWSALKLLNVPNPNSGVDAIKLADGRALLVYNPTRQGPYGRSSLAVAISKDGENWKDVLTFEDTRSGEYSYPAVIQSRDGLVHITYTWKRQRIKHVIINAKDL